MILKEYKKENLKDIIKKYFSMDKDLITTYHLVSGTNLDTCINQTFNDLQPVDNTFKFFEILEDNKEFGYFGYERNATYLTTIFVNPEYRNKDNMFKLWNLIKSQLEPKFETAIYKKNTRALNFYLKNGANIVREGIHNNTIYVLLEFKEV